MGRKKHVVAKKASTPAKPAKPGKQFRLVDKNRVGERERAGWKVSAKQTGKTPNSVLMEK